MILYISQIMKHYRKFKVNVFITQYKSHVCWDTELFMETAHENVLSQYKKNLLSNVNF